MDGNQVNRRADNPATQRHFLPTAQPDRSETRSSGNTSPQVPALNRSGNATEPQGRTKRGRGAINGSAQAQPNDRDMTRYRNVSLKHLNATLFLNILNTFAFKLL